MLGLWMYRGSCVYRFGAEPYKLVKTRALAFVIQGLAEKVGISWSPDHWGLGPSFTAYLCNFEQVIYYLHGLVFHL